MKHVSFFSSASPRLGRPAATFGLHWLLPLLLLLALYAPAQAQTNFPEGFESGSKVAYASGTVTLPTGAWTLADALIGTADNDKKVGARSVRMTNVGTVTMNFDVSTGASTVSLSHARYGTDAASTWELWLSTDGGSTFAKVGNTMTSTTTLQTASFTVNRSGNVRFQVRKLTGGSSGRLNIDQFDIQPFGGTPLRTGTVSGSPFCVPATSGTALSVPYTSPADLTGTFAVQLSSAQGVFSTDLTQNLIGQGTSSPLAATLPAGTPAGTGYRVRVVHVASSTAGQDNGTNLMVTVPPATNTVTVSPDTNQPLTTTGTGATLTASATAPSTYAWYYASSTSGPFSMAISGATAATYTLRGADFGGTAGTYYLVARASSTCGSVEATSAPITVTVSAPTPSLTVTPLTVPNFGSVTVGAASSASPVVVEGSNLSAPVTFTPPAGFEIRTGTGAFACCAITLTPTAGSLARTTIDVRFVPALLQPYASELAVASPELPSQANVALSGTGVAPVYPAVVATAPISALTPTGAVTGGNVQEDGNSPVTGRGVVYAVTANPTLADDFTQDGTGLGTYTSTLTGLTGSTLYYVRAYATNAVGTVYGEQLSFTTPAATLALEPTTSSTLTATAVNPTTVTLALSGGTGAKKLLLATQGPSLTAQPTDGTTYSANARLGQGDQLASGVSVVLAGTASSVTITGLRASTEYTFVVFDYNDDNTAGAENYRVPGSAELTLTTPVQPAELLLAEDFDYPAGERLTAHGWAAHSAAGSSPILVTSQGLTRPGYGATAGQAAALTASGEDLNRQFTAQEAGTAVYASLLVSVSSSTASDYFFHFAPTDLSTGTFRGRLFVRPAATTGKVQFGLSGSSGTASQFAPGEYDLNVAQLLVVRYTFGPSGTETRLYVNPGQTEPTTAEAVATDGASFAPGNIGSVALRQGSNQSPLVVDGLRVATSFALARPGGGPLPVTLAAFTAQASGADVRLRWTTAQELRNDRFEVERSADAQHFTRVGTVAGQGTSALAHSYSYLDAQALTAGQPVYYRLRQVDTNGPAAYSDVLTVKAATAAPQVALRLFPNPAHGSVHVEGATTPQVEVLDLMGRVLGRYSATRALPLTGLAPGVYLVRSATRTVRLVVE